MGTTVNFTLDKTEDASFLLIRSESMTDLTSALNSIEGTFFVTHIGVEDGMYFALLDFRSVPGLDFLLEETDIYDPPVKPKLPVSSA